MRTRRKLNHRKQGGSQSQVSSIQREAETEGPVLSGDISSGAPKSNEEMTEEIKQGARRQEEFFNYLKKKRIAKAKEEELISTNAREREFLDEERMERWMNSQGLLYDEFELSENFMKDKDEDFILPDEDELLRDDEMSHVHNDQDEYRR